jgi:hypothetical protein
MGRATRSKDGFTVIELLIGLTLFTGLILLFTLTIGTITGTYREGRAEGDLIARAHRVVTRVADRLAMSERERIVGIPAAGFGATTLQFHVASGWAGSTIWAPDESVFWELERGELDDGRDNNGNGLVDEGVIVWVQDVGLPNERRVVLASGVAELAEGEAFNGLDDNGDGLIDEGGLSFAVEGDVVTVGLTLQTVDRDKRVLSRSVRTAVAVRN